MVDYTENVQAADTERVVRSYAKSGSDIIFGTTFEHMDPMLMVAKDFPNTVFEHCSGYKTAKNLGNYFARMEQSEYLAGYMAGLMGFKNVGTVATQPIPEPIRGINAFTLGLLRGLKEGNRPHDPAKVNTVVWLKKWLDPINEVVLAEALINQKHDLIRQMADTPDSARTACYKKVPTIGYGMDVRRSGADCALVSTTWNWGPYYVDAVKRVMNKTWKPQEIFWGFKENLIGLSSFHASVGKSVQEKVRAEVKKMQEGKDDSFLGGQGSGGEGDHPGGIARHGQGVADNEMVCQGRRRNDPGIGPWRQARSFWRAANPRAGGPWFPLCPHPPVGLAPGRRAGHPHRVAQPGREGPLERRPGESWRVGSARAFPTSPISAS